MAFLALFGGPIVLGAPRPVSSLLQQPWARAFYTQIRFTLQVDHSRSYAEMRAEGRYDYITTDARSDIFRVEGTGVRRYDARLHCGQKGGSPEQIVAESQQNGWQLGKVAHVLAFGAKYPEHQRRFPIVGLGSIITLRGVQVAPTLTCWVRAGQNERVFGTSNMVPGKFPASMPVLLVRPVAD